MKIIQLADLHIGETMPDLKEARGLMKRVGQDISEGEDVAVCVCGDIIDKGSKGKIQLKYDNAKSIFQIIKDKLDELKCNYKFMLVPGNHDIYLSSFFRNFLEGKTTAPFDHFCNFAKEITGGTDYDDLTQNGFISIEFGHINWILVNSSQHANKEYGQIQNPDLIKEAIDIARYPSVILVHHTLLSDGSEDTSTLRNGYQLLKAVENKAIAILHGHTHGFKNIKIGNTCLLVGVGPFYKAISGINKQLNTISIGSNGVNNIKNYYWRDDTSQTVLEELYHYNGNITYNNRELGPLISQVRSDVQEQICLHNVAIHYQSTFAEMELQIEKAFVDDLAVAREWQKASCPDTLYYNHGSIINHLDSMKYVKEKLQKNPTSRRALITLLSQNTVQRNGDAFLPSFDLVQFSFSDHSRRELVITLNMRALEVSHFLSVNFCELYLLAKDIIEDMPLTAVNVSIFAHRVTYIKDFYGFRKAELDRAKKEDLDSYIQKRDFAKIISMLADKIGNKETLLHVKGIELLQQCVASSDLDRRNDLVRRIEHFKNAIITINKKHSSNSSSYDYEKVYLRSGEYAGLKKAYNALISELESLSGGASDGT